ncbi:9244_t:CDS:2, partial [Acaulospora morrowiae]
MSSDSSSTNLRVIKNETMCVCDFRINYKGCDEESILQLSHLVLIPYTVIIMLISLGLMWHRIVVRGEPFFLNPTRERGILRPKPQEVFHIAAIVFNFFQLIHMILVLTNSYPNTVSAEIGQDLSREFGTGLALIYPISMFYSTPNCSSTTESMSEGGPQISKSFNKYLVDVTGFFVLIAPVATMLPLAYLTGHYADRESAYALQLSNIHSFVWIVWVIIFLGSAIFFWYKLMVVIWDEINELKRKGESDGSDVQPRIITLRRAARNLFLVKISLAIVVIIFVIITLSYTIYHKEKTLFNKNINVGYMIIWDFTIPIIFNITQFIFIYNILRSEPEQDSAFMLQDLKSHTSDNSKTNPRFMEKQKQILGASKEGQIAVFEFDEESTMSVGPNSPISSEKRRINNQLQRPSIELQHSLYSNASSVSRRDSYVSNDSSSDGTIDVNQDNGNDGYDAINDGRNAADAEVYYDSRLTNSPRSNSRFHLRGSMQTSISTLSDLSLSPTSSISDELGMVMYPSFLASRGFGSTNHMRRSTLQLHHHKSYESSMGLIIEETSDNRNDNHVVASSSGDMSHNNTAGNSVSNAEGGSKSSNTSSAVNPVALALAKAKSEEDLTNSNETYKATGLYKQRESVSMIDVNEMQDWLKRPVSTIHRIKTIQRLNQ